MLMFLQCPDNLYPFFCPLVTSSQTAARDEDDDVLLSIYTPVTGQVIFNITFLVQLFYRGAYTLQFLKNGQLCITKKNRQGYTKLVADVLTAIFYGLPCLILLYA